MARSSGATAAEPLKLNRRQAPLSRLPGSALCLVPTLEELDRAFVLQSGGPAGKRAEIAALASLGVFLARVQAVLAGFEPADHEARCIPGSSTSCGLRCRRLTKWTTSPITPRRNASTQTTKIVPWITVTHEPSSAR